MNDKEKLSDWMTEQGYATGHGDTLENLLRELEWQILEDHDDLCGILRMKLRKSEVAKAAANSAKNKEIERLKRFIAELASALAAKGESAFLKSDVELLRRAEEIEQSLRS